MMLRKIVFSFKCLFLNCSLLTAVELEVMQVLCYMLNRNVVECLNFEHKYVMYKGSLNLVAVYVCNIYIYIILFLKKKKEI